MPPGADNNILKIKSPVGWKGAGTDGLACAVSWQREDQEWLGVRSHFVAFYSLSPGLELLRK